MPVEVPDTVLSTQLPVKKPGKAWIMTHVNPQSCDLPFSCLGRIISGTAGVQPQPSSELEKGAWNRQKEKTNRAL